MLFGYEKQEEFAKKCGWSQQKMSKLEPQEVMEPEDMKVISEVLGIPEATIRNFDEDRAVYNIQTNTSHDSSTNQNQLNYEPTFNQDVSEKVLDALTTLTKTVADLAAQAAALVKHHRCCRGDPHDLDGVSNHCSIIDVMHFVNLMINFTLK